MSNNDKEIIKNPNDLINIDPNKKLQDTSINLDENKETKEDQPNNLKTIQNNVSINNNTNIMLNQKRERNESNNKEEMQNNLEEKANTPATVNAEPIKKIGFKDAKKEMEDVEKSILQTEEDLKKKYGCVLPQLEFEDNFPDEIKIKLIDSFFESPEIVNILNEANKQK